VRPIEQKKTHDLGSSGVGSKHRNWKRLLGVQHAPARGHNRAAATTTAATALAADLHRPRGYTRIAPDGNDLVSAGIGPPGMNKRHDARKNLLERTAIIVILITRELVKWLMRREVRNL